MKKFRDFITEGKTGFAEHDEATKLVKKHAKGIKVDHAEGEHEMDDSHVHMSAVHPDHVKHLGDDLKAHGFEHKGSKAGAHVGAHSRDDADYHHYQKGATHVKICTKPNTWGKKEGEVHDHHHVEVHTNKADWMEH